VTSLSLFLLEDDMEKKRDTEEGWKVAHMVTLVFIFYLIDFLTLAGSIVYAVTAGACLGLGLHERGLGLLVGVSVFFSGMAGRSWALGKYSKIFLLNKKGTPNLPTP
jgi:hypothetical protein